MKTQKFYFKPAGNVEDSSDESQVEYKLADAVVKTHQNPWDQAHEIKKSTDFDGYIEPDLDDQNPQARRFHETTKIREGLEATPLADDEYDPNWPFPGSVKSPKKMIWHQHDNYSQLRKAWNEVSTSDNVVRVAHFDTGYDPNHPTFPLNIEIHLQKNFVEANNSAEDIESEGWLKMPGHGTGTLSILAGKKIKLEDYDNFDDYIGVHNNIKIVPIRISKSVVLWKNQAFVDALNYIIALYDNPTTRCHVVTMSMGGMPSKAWADVVNRAYEKGIFIVTASGNNFGRLTPSTLVYPARFQRVTAACGVNYDMAPYYKDFKIKNIKTMGGNFGPRKAMKKAVAAFTPNVPWAMIGTQVVSLNGAGTSSATPQIAAAAAIYYQKYFDQLEKMEGWQKVESIRYALYKSANKKLKKGFEDYELYVGNGVLQAWDMLQIKPDILKISKTDPDQVSWPFLKMLTGANLESTGEELESAQDSDLEMYEVEILQLISKSAAIQTLLEEEELDFSGLTEKEKKQLFGIILEMDAASDSLKSFILKNGLS